MRPSWSIQQDSLLIKQTLHQICHLSVLGNRFVFFSHDPEDERAAKTKHLDSLTSSSALSYRDSPETTLHSPTGMWVRETRLFCFPNNVAEGMGGYILICASHQTFASNKPAWAEPAVASATASLQSSQV